ncbi:MAG: acetylxylan esterase [Solirubrobacteraceae bacterium]
MMLTLRKLFATSLVVVGVMVAPSAASATITQVFGSIPCTTQTAVATAGQRWCGASAGTTVPSFDGTPIDIAMAFPAESGADNNYPVIGIYHGWGGSKIVPSSSSVQRWVTQGYAVFSISDRGWGSSCGSPSKPANTVKAAPCEHGWIHLMSRKYEVRDVQTLLGKLADEGLINPQQIGATGGSYGGGMSLQLGSLKDRVELLNGELVPWESPGGKAMKIAATAPEYPWSDIATALQPNGSSLDFVANDPYNGINHEFRFGIEKNNWNASLYGAGALIGYYGPSGEPEGNLTEWHNFNIKGGPYDGEPLALQQEEYLPFHSAYYTPLNEAPAPSIMENGWNDDLFPVDETVRYYNRVRSVYPSEPMKLFYMDLGHNPRSATTVSTSDVAKLQNAQNKWFKYYIKGEGGEPSEAHGGVTAITSFCPQTAGGSGTEYDAPNWASLAPGEVHLAGAAEQTIQSPATAPANAFTSGTVCTTSSAAANASAATYKVSPAPASGYTIAGSSTVIGEFSAPGANDQVIARLYDENVSANTEQLIGRAMLRPLNPGGGFTKTELQLHPQAWNVAAGHVVKLELLTADSTYARNSSSPHSVQVKNLEMRIPTTDAPGSAEGLVQAPLPKYLPSGYTLALNFAPAAPSAPHLVSGSNPNASGQFTLAWEASQAATTPTYTLQHKSASSGWSTVATGLTSPEYTFTAGSPEAEGTWTYRVTESNAGSEGEASSASEEVKVDKTGPYAPTATPDRAPDYAGGGGWYKDTVTVSFTDNGDPVLADGSAGTGVDLSTLSAPQTFNTDGSHTASGTVADNVGNVSEAGTLRVQVDASAPSLEVNCPASTPVGSKASASVVASDGQSGLAEDPSGTVPIDTSEAGPQTIERTATDNVGHSTSSSCTTQVVETSVISGRIKHKLVVKEGEAVELTATAQTNAIEVQSGGSLDVEGATTKGIKASGASVIRICGAHVGALKLTGGTGAVTIGDGEGCAGNTDSAGATLTGNTDGVTVIGNSFKGSVKVAGNSGGVTVTGNTIAKNLTVTGNSGTVVDSPNSVGGKTKAQAHIRRRS